MFVGVVEREGCCSANPELWGWSLLLLTNYSSIHNTFLNRPFTVLDAETLQATKINLEKQSSRSHAYIPRSCAVSQRDDALMMLNLNLVSIKSRQSAEFQDGLSSPYPPSADYRHHSPSSKNVFRFQCLRFEALRI